MKIKTLILRLIIGSIVITGCSVQPVKPPVQYNINESLKEIDYSLADVEIASVPEVNKPTLIKSDGKEYAAFEESDFDKLRRLKNIASKNTEVAKILLDINKELIKDRNLIIQLAKMEELRANYNAERWAEVKTELKERKRQHILDVWGYRILILLIGAMSL